MEIEYLPKVQAQPYYRFIAGYQSLETINWVDLNSAVEAMSKKSSYSDWKRLFADINCRPFNQQSIDYLTGIGWHTKIELIEEPHQFGFCDLGKKVIFIDQQLDPYDRDKTLFHELAHAWYGLELSDSEGVFAPPRRIGNNLIAEWLGRSWRADPILLRQAVAEFDLKPAVYDQSSWQAFAMYSDKLDLQIPLTGFYHQLPIFMS